MATPRTTRRHSLDERIARGTEASTGLRWFCLGLAAAPLLLAFAADVCTALIPSYRRSILTPWIEPRAPMQPLIDHVDPNGWGDLRKAARLPYYDAQLGSPLDSRRRFTTDELGFLNHPAGGAGPRLEEVEVFVTGTSFSALADDVDHNLAAQLAAASGRRVYNTSWPGGGLTLGIFDLLENHVRAEQTIVWVIVQRQLKISNFRDVWRRLGAEGDWKPLSALERGVNLLRRLRVWPQQLEGRADAKSFARGAAERVAFVLPIALDRGANSSVRLAELTAPRRLRMLFFDEEISAGYQDFESAGGPSLLAGIERVARACERRQVRLVLVLIPDKFSFFARNIEPQLHPAVAGDQHRDLPAVPLLASLSAALDDRSIEAVDLTPVLRAAQDSSPEADPLYRIDDSHWSDEAIAVSARHLAKVLEVSPTRTDPAP